MEVVLCLGEGAFSLWGIPSRVRKELGCQLMNMRTALGDNAQSFSGDFGASALLKHKQSCLCDARSVICVGIVRPETKDVRRLVM